MYLFVLTLKLDGWRYERSNALLRLIFLKGVPDVIKEALAKAGLTEEQVLADPSLAKDILYDIPISSVQLTGRADPNISAPKGLSHHVAIKYNQETGKFEVGTRSIIFRASKKKAAYIFPSVSWKPFVVQFFFFPDLPFLRVSLLK